MWGLQDGLVTFGLPTGRQDNQYPLALHRMLQQWFNWRTGLAGIAMAIVIATIFYSRYLARTIAAEERQKVEAWAEAQQFIAGATPDENISFASIIMAGQTSIPIIETNERDSITNHHNLDSARVQQDPDYLPSRLAELKRNNSPIITYLDQQHKSFNKYYYGESLLLKQVRYYPIVQLVIVALFILITLIALTTRHRAAQDQLWAGMAKETAHQLGTPLSALQGWLEMMKESPPDTHMLTEMEKDINRLKLVSDRFSKIGSTPHLEEHDLVHVLGNVVEYVRKRAPGRVRFTIETGGVEALPVHISAPLFEWVVENLLKNALDAMDGKGDIRVTLAEHAKEVMVDISDTGKGISAANLHKVFNPGFTTKKRGWGLGLTLSRRIIEQYHHGRLFVKSAEVSKGTTFRIILNK
jgi:signal transduction histidine kinase